MKKLLTSVSLICAGFCADGMDGAIVSIESRAIAPMRNISSPITDIVPTGLQNQAISTIAEITRFGAFEIDGQNARITWNYGRNTDEGFLIERSSSSICPVELHPNGYDHQILGNFSLIRYLITANTPQIGRITLSDNYTFSDQRINHKFTAPVSQYHDDAARTDRIVRDRFIEVDGLPVTVVAEELVEEARPYIIDSSTNHHEPIIHHSDATNNYYSQYEMRNYRRFDGTILENVRIDLADFYAVVIPPVQPANPGGKTITHNNGPSNEFERFGQFLGGGSCNVM